MAAKVLRLYTLLYIVYRGFLWCFALYFDCLRGRGTPQGGTFGWRGGWRSWAWRVHGDEGAAARRDATTRGDGGGGGLGGMAPWGGRLLRVLHLDAVELVDEVAVLPFQSCDLAFKVGDLLVLLHDDSVLFFDSLGVGGGLLPHVGEEGGGVFCA